MNAPLQTQAKARNKFEFTPTATGLLHRKCACGSHAMDGECTECGKQKRLGLQTKLQINEPGGRYEQEADRIADQVMRMPEPDVLRRGEVPSQSQRGNGNPLPSSSISFFEPLFGYDFSGVRVHTDSKADTLNRALNARAFTYGRDVYFGAGNYKPDTESGRRLIAHELTHVVQQGRASRNFVQHQATSAKQSNEQLTGPLTNREWQLLEMWQSFGEVGGDPLTDDADHNALVVAAAIFCGRLIGSDQFSVSDPLLCVIPQVTRVDPRVQQLVQHVTARGPIVNWAQVAPDQRILNVMELLVDTYHFPVNGAAGLVGNLWSESGVLPNRIEGSRPRTPMTAQISAGQSTEFMAEEVMNRNPAAGQGPRLPGIGLAQWTSANRRAGLFQHTFQGRQQGAAILFNMDAQVDYLVTELQTNYPHVYSVLTSTGVSLNDASDEVVYRFEVPGAILGANGRLPRSNSAVQVVFRRRRANSQRALRLFRTAQLLRSLSPSFWVRLF